MMKMAAIGKQCHQPTLQLQDAPDILTHGNTQDMPLLSPMQGVAVYCKL
jgi:hypothetical protein